MDVLWIRYMLRYFYSLLGSLRHVVLILVGLPTATGIPHAANSEVPHNQQLLTLLSKVRVELGFFIFLYYHLYYIFTFRSDTIYLYNSVFNQRLLCGETCYTATLLLQLLLYYLHYTNTITWNQFR